VKKNRRGKPSPDLREDLTNKHSHSLVDFFLPPGNFSVRSLDFFLLWRCFHGLLLNWSTLDFLFIFALLRWMILIAVNSTRETTLKTVNVIG